MMRIGFHRSNYDSCVYFKKFPDGSFMYLLLYVDDMLVAASSKEEIKKVKDRLYSIPTSWYSSLLLVQMLKPGFQ